MSRGFRTSTQCDVTLALQRYHLAPDLPPTNYVYLYRTWRIRPTSSCEALPAVAQLGEECGVMPTPKRKHRRGLSRANTMRRVARYGPVVCCPTGSRLPFAFPSELSVPFEIATNRTDPLFNTNGNMYCSNSSESRRSADLNIAHLDTWCPRLRPRR